MRLDRFLAACALGTRSEVRGLVRAGRVTVDGVPVRDPGTAVSETESAVALDGQALSYQAHRYLMLYKPEGVVSATEDPGCPTVLDLLPEPLRKLGLFPCGRLDKSTTGLVLLTDDGPLCHRLLAPKNRVEKEYRFEVKYPLSEDDAAALEEGILLRADSTAAEWKTAPCRVETDPGRRSGRIVLTEGKYHEIKRMMEAVHNQITALRGVAFAGVRLDPALSPGEWRDLTREETESLRLAGGEIRRN